MSWEQLLAIQQQNAAWRSEHQQRPPASCPNDGTRLEAGPDGSLHCPFDGYAYAGGPPPD